MPKSVQIRKTPPWLALPLMGWMLWFLVIPTAIVCVYSFLSKGIYGGIVFKPSLENYSRALDPLYLQIFSQSLKLALLTSISCLVLGYPMAYVMATSAKKYRGLLMILLIIPFWTNLVVRTYALKVLISEQGPITSLLMSLHLIHEPLQLSNSYLMVWLGMVNCYLPYMVLPLYVAIEKVDFSLLEAGRDLGASSAQNFFKVLVPLTQSGIITGLILVFTPALGEFLIPDLLGGARTMMIGNLITEQFLKMRDWPFGSALSMVLMFAVTLGLLGILKVWSKEDLREAIEG